MFIFYPYFLILTCTTSSLFYNRSRRDNLSLSPLPPLPRRGRALFDFGRNGRVWGRGGSGRLLDAEGQLLQRRGQELLGVDEVLLGGGEVQPVGR